MRAPRCRCASASQRAPRWRPSEICSGGPRARRDGRSQTVLWATQRRRACAGAPGSGCGRSLGSLQRRGPHAVAVLAAGCPPHPAAAADHPRIPGVWSFSSLTVNGDSNPWPPHSTARCVLVGTAEASGEREGKSVQGHRLPRPGSAAYCTPSDCIPASRPAMHRPAAAPCRAARSPSPRPTPTRLYSSGSASPRGARATGCGRGRRVGS